MHIATTNGILVMIQIAMQIQKFLMKFLPLRDKKKTILGILLITQASSRRRFLMKFLRVSH